MLVRFNYPGQICPICRNSSVDFHNNAAKITELVVNTSHETMYIYFLATFNAADLKIYCATDKIKFWMVFEMNYFSKQWSMHITS